MSDTEDYATIEEVAQVNADPPITKTLLCNRCNMPIFGDNWLSPTACCADLFCKYCWDTILRDAERCMRYGCENRLLEKSVMYLTEDCEDLLSRERDITQQLKLEDPGFQRLNEDIAVVKAQTERQHQQIEELTKMNTMLEDQIVQSAGQLEAVHSETNQLKALAMRANQQTATIFKSNKDLEATIHTLQGQIQALNRMAASVKPANSAPVDVEQ